MKIVHLVNYFQPQLGYQEYYLAKEQANAGHEVYVITSNRYFPFFDYENTVQQVLGSRIFHPKEEKIEGFTLINLPILYEQPGRRVWLKGLKKRLKNFIPDLVHVHGEYTVLAAQGVLWKKKLGYKLVVDSHSHPHDFRRYSKKKKSPISKIRSFLVKTFYCKYIFTRKDVKWIATTEWNRKYLIDKCGFSPEELTLLPNGSDMGIFFPDSDARRKKRRELEINDNDIVILYTGMISEFKGVHKIIEASQKWAQKFHLKYVFVGNINEQFYQKFSSFIKDVEDYVILHKAVHNKDLPAFYQLADIACWPMESSLSAVDAMASGLPIIVCDKLLERLKNDNGIGIEEGNVEQLRDALYTLVNNKELRISMGKRGRELVKKEMNWTNISQRFIDIGCS